MAKIYGWIEGKVEVIREVEVDVNDTEMMGILKDSNTKRSEYVDLSGIVELDVIEALIRPLKSNTDWTAESVEKAHHLFVTEDVKDLDDIAFELRSEFKVKFKEGSIRRILSQESMDHFTWEGSDELRSEAKAKIEERSKSRSGFDQDDMDYIFFRKEDGITGGQIARDLSDRKGRKIFSASVNSWIKKNITLGSYVPKAESIDDLYVEEEEDQTQ